MLEQCRQHGRPLPPEFENAPELLPGLEMYFEAFANLTTCRPIALGMSFVEGPIPWTAINDYCIRMGLVGRQRYAMENHVRALDAIYLEKRDKQAAAKSKKSATKIPPGRHKQK